MIPWVSAPSFSNTAGACGTDFSSDPIMKTATFCPASFQPAEICHQLELGSNGKLDIGCKTGFARIATVLGALHEEKTNYEQVSQSDLCCISIYTKVGYYHLVDHIFIYQSTDVDLLHKKRST